MAGTICVVLLFYYYYYVKMVETVIADAMQGITHEEVNLIIKMIMTDEISIIRKKIDPAIVTVIGMIIVRMMIIAGKVIGIADVLHAKSQLRRNLLL